MQDNINKFHKEAFSTSENFQYDVDDSFEKSLYAKGLRTQGMIVEKYTSGDTRYQQEQPLQNNYLTTLPSKISKRYSPQNKEQNTGAPIPPDPSFMKNNSHSERIKTVRGLFDKDEDKSIAEKSKFIPVPGVDFARTHADAALFLSKLGKDVSYEAHYSAIHKDLQETIDVGEARITSAGRIVVESINTSLSKMDDFDSKIILNSIPDKNYDNLNLVAIGYENLIDSQVKSALKSREEKINTIKTFIASSKQKLSNAILLSDVTVSNDEADILRDFENGLKEQSIKTTRSQNIVNLVEQKMNASDSHEITNIEDAPIVIRKVIEDFTQMKEQHKERKVQMKTIENKVKKIIQTELPKEVETNDNDAVNEIREIIREVVENHPNIIQRNNDKDMEFSLAARDTFLRVQIEQELRDKFDSKIVDNNKLMEKQNRAMFEEMMYRFLNP